MRCLYVKLDIRYARRRRGFGGSSCPTTTTAALTRVLFYAYLGEAYMCVGSPAKITIHAEPCLDCGRAPYLPLALDDRSKVWPLCKKREEARRTYMTVQTKNKEGEKASRT